MIPEFLITFRETLEAALIVGIILTYLVSTKRKTSQVYWGIGAGILGSLLVAFLFNFFFGGFEGKAEEIFEGIMMIIAAGIIIYVVLWMRKNSSKNIESGIDKKGYLGIFFLVFFSVVREGIETVIFLSAIGFASSGISLLGAILGIVFAIILGYLLFYFGKKIHFKQFFSYTSVLLMVFALWLFYSGLHELSEVLL